MLPWAHDVAAITEGSTVVRIGVLSDIHGNLIALEAVLADLADVRVDHMVCLGDVAAMGPQPRESIKRVRSLDCPVVMGNTDEWLVQPATNNTPADDREQILRDFASWAAGQLGPDDVGFVRSFQPTVEVALDEAVTLLCYHGSPRSNTDRIMPTTPDDDLDLMMAGTTAPVLVGGHTHEAMLRRYRGRVILNPGSISLPYHHLPVTAARGRTRFAEYGVIEWSNGRLIVDWRSVPYDLNAVEAAARANDMPHLERWLSGWD